MTKYCKSCNQEKDIGCFSRAKSHSGGYYFCCKSCAKEKKRRYLSNNQDKVKAYRDWYYKTHKEQRQKWHKLDKKKRPLWYKEKKLKERYGITLLDYNNLSEKQNGLCAICGKPMKHIHVDHDHKIGRVRGLLCGWCNWGIGYFRDNILTLKRAIAYLEDYTKLTANSL